MPGHHLARIGVDVDRSETRFGPRYFHVLAVWVHCETHPGGAMYFCFAHGSGCRQMVMTAEKPYRHSHG
jgi:hypothetical protein